MAFQIRPPKSYRTIHALYEPSGVPIWNAITWTNRSGDGLQTFRPPATCYDCGEPVPSGQLVYIIDNDVVCCECEFERQAETFGPFSDAADYYRGAA